MEWGIDVSSYRDCDFGAFRAAGGRFVIFAMGDGRGVADADLGVYVQRARDAGLTIGVYQFDRPRRLTQGNMQEEVDAIVEGIRRGGGLRNGDLRFGMDIEVDVREDAVDIAQFERELRARLQDALQHDPLLYSGWDFARRHFPDLGADLWLSWWPNVGSPEEATQRWTEAAEPPPAPGLHVVMWQYGGDVNGGVPGIPACDVNIAPTLDGLVLGGAVPAPAEPLRPIVVFPEVVPNFGRYLRNGMVGDDVGQVQAKLLERGWAIAVDNQFGEETERVVRNFQSQVMGPEHEDGVVGPDTVAALWILAFDATRPRPATHPVLRQNVDGPSPAVREAQDKLRALGHDPGATDGWFGTNTFNAAVALQREHGLVDDGVIGPDTWAVLDAPLPAPAPIPAEPVPTPAGPAHPDPVGQILAWQFEKGVEGFQEAFAWYDLGVDGVAGEQTAVAVQVIVDNGGMIAAHFHLDECRSHGNGRVLVHREWLRSAELARGGEPQSYSNVYRDPVHNAAIGGASDSMHMYGLAGDPSPFQPRARMEQGGFTGIGVSAGSGLISHVDRRDVLGRASAEFPDN